MTEVTLSPEEVEGETRAVCHDCRAAVAELLAGDPTGDLFAPQGRAPKPKRAKAPPPPEPPPADTPHWFTPLDWFLRTEASLLEERLIPRPFDLDPFGHPEAPVSLEIAKRPGGKVAIGLELGQVDGMAESWAGGVVWVNTGPYRAAHLKRVAVKMNAEASLVDGMAWLGPNWRDRKWFHEEFAAGLCSGEIHARDLQGRLCFGWPGVPQGHKRRPAFHHSLLLVWTPMASPTAVGDAGATLWWLISTEPGAPAIAHAYPGADRPAYDGPGVSDAGTALCGALRPLSERPASGPRADYELCEACELVPR